MQTQDNIFQQKLQAFIAGDLNDQERAIFLQETNADPEMAAELRFSQDLAGALRRQEHEAMSTMLRQIISEEGFPPPAAPASPAPRFGRTSYLAFGTAIIAALIGVGVLGFQLGWFGTGGPSPADNYLEPLENVNMIPEGSAIAPVLQDGLKAYESKDFAQAATLLGKYYGVNRELNIGLYYGISLLLSERYKDAIKVLEGVRQSDELPIRESAEWYLALAYFKAGDNAQANQILENIPANGLYADKAKELLKKQ
jgi:hypothetical protein